MPISIDHRRVGDIAIVTCRGRIVEGDESVALKKTLDDALQFGPDLILHVGGVDFLDSSGLGLLVRYAARTHNARGCLKLCAPSSKVKAVLQATHLDGVFESFETEENAIRAFYERPVSGSDRAGLTTDVLCVDPSPDVQAYVRELLRRAGFGVLTAGNLPDALVLLQATRPKLLVVGADLRRARDTHAAETFNRLADAMLTVELAGDFGHRDAADAGQVLLEQVRALRQ